MKRNTVESEKFGYKMSSVSITFEEKKTACEILNLGYHSKSVLWNVLAKQVRFTLFIYEEKP